MAPGSLGPHPRPFSQQHTHVPSASSTPTLEEAVLTTRRPLNLSLWLRWILATRTASVPALLPLHATWTSAAAAAGQKAGGSRQLGGWQQEGE